jgi:hypothetical protein
MTVDPSINLPTVVTLIIAIIGVVTWLIRMEGKVNSTDKTADSLGKEVNEARREIGAVEALVILHKEQLHDYQLQAAKEFMTQAAFGEIKRELVGEINRMEGRLEAQIERIGNRPPGPGK